MKKKVNENKSFILTDNTRSPKDFPDLFGNDEFVGEEWDFWFQEDDQMPVDETGPIPNAPNMKCSCGGEDFGVCFARYKRGCFIKTYCKKCGNEMVLYNVGGR
jgi:hypothetical protein